MLDVALDLLAELGYGKTSPREAAEVLGNRKLFQLHLRNEKALERIQHARGNEHDHAGLQEQMLAVLRSPTIPVPLRVRMACSFGAVMGAIVGAGEAFADVPPDDLARMVRGAVHDLMGVA
ncbi:MAG: hypothetical protein M0Z33_07165 [Actinomycetota bacterium]|nr:hypothetical protein [Actinomycetota bacterium]